MLKNINLAVRFLLELAALAALGWWGARMGSSTMASVGMALGAPLLAALFWGALVSPKAHFGGSRTRRLLLGLVVFGLAAAAIMAMGHAGAGIAFGVVCLVNTVLTHALGPQPGETSPAD